MWEFFNEESSGKKCKTACAGTLRARLFWGMGALFLGWSVLGPLQVVGK
jgi:hypothetical protein